MRGLAVCAAVLGVACAVVMLGCNGSVTLGTGGEEQVFDATDYVGTWTGQWQNTTQGGQGAATMVIAANESLKTFTINFDLDGEVMPGFDPPPVVGAGNYDDDGATLTNNGTAMGDLDMTVAKSGAFTGSFTNVPHADVTRIDFQGTASQTQIIVTFQVELAAGGTVVGTVTFIKA